MDVGTGKRVPQTPEKVKVLLMIKNILRKFHEINKLHFFSSCLSCVEIFHSFSLLNPSLRSGDDYF